jgi:hypothetical protein
MPKFMTVHPWKIVAVDPGYRNLAWVSFSFHPISKKVELLERRHVDVGSCKTQTDIICKVWTALKLFIPFHDADYVIIEDQMIGPQTKPNNQGLAWLLATTAMHQSTHCSIELMGAKRKFSVFKSVQLPHKLKRGEKKDRRKKIKANSIYLANTLLLAHDIAPGLVLDKDKPNTWDHLADAVCMAMVKLKELAK